jgi:hypothetical protein
MTASASSPGGGFGIAVRLSGPASVAAASPAVHLKLREPKNPTFVREDNPEVSFQCEGEEPTVVCEARIRNAFPKEPALSLGEYLLDIEVVLKDGTRLGVKDMPFTVERFREGK